MRFGPHLGRDLFTDPYGAGWVFNTKNSEKSSYREKRCIVVVVIQFWKFHLVSSSDARPRAWFGAYKTKIAAIKWRLLSFIVYLSSGELLNFVHIFWYLDPKISGPYGSVNGAQNALRTKELKLLFFDSKQLFPTSKIGLDYLVPKLGLEEKNWDHIWTH